MLKRTLFAAAFVLLGLVAFLAWPASRADVVGCGGNLALFSSPVGCGGVAGPTVTVFTPATQAPSVAFNISGQYFNGSAPTGIKFCTSTSTGYSPALRGDGLPAKRVL